MSTSVPPFLQILTNRVRRNYTGGALLEQWTGEGNGGDDERPEDWIASTVRAVNPGLGEIKDEGLTRVRLPDGGERILADLLAEQPDDFLGERHVENTGHELGFLAKLLDSAIRLHVQAHPTAKFSQEHLASRYGKLETYVVLAVREGADPYLRLGFQHAPTRDEWKRIIEEQDIPAMDACFERIPLQVGDVWRVPGGLPHAIGEGALVLEVMEPSDWVVRCEFEREGIVVPPEGRFMRRGLDFCLNIFDYTERSVSDIRELCQIQPKVLAETDTCREEELVGRAHTDCFGVNRLTISGETQLPASERIGLYLVSEGEGQLASGDHSLSLRKGSRFIRPAKGGEVSVTPTGEGPLELCHCYPGLA
ncbi:class I mannose-6-phosphate isomerase [Ruficoccus sp. ZRK36]|uniref:class I mannose-6-phosphate isomerase n=1 Tax=Ruficoccus sp. ZRK36 TaxID=2866311 RepID=UPI001C73A0B8|nr:class I mannose-6-phosphate isomerase [Ruficoccus sp. ZRK36]QYY35047.1 class I mannose-6-phosphate isomerase [Ruficoccus sp. ZRK36]